MYKNQGDILSYNPDLFINSKPNSSEATVIVNTEYEGNPADYVIDKVERSASLESFEAQKPSLQVNDLMNMQNYISKYKYIVNYYQSSNSNFPKITPEKLSLDIDENNYIGKILHIWRFKVNKNM